MITQMLGIIGWGRIVEIWRSERSGIRRLNRATSDLLPTPFALNSFFFPLLTIHLARPPIHTISHKAYLLRIHRPPCLAQVAPPRLVMLPPTPPASRRHRARLRFSTPTPTKTTCYRSSPERDDCYKRDWRLCPHRLARSLPLYRHPALSSVGSHSIDLEHAAPRNNVLNGKADLDRGELKDDEGDADGLKMRFEESGAAEKLSIPARKAQANGTHATACASPQAF